MKNSKPHPTAKRGPQQRKGKNNNHPPRKAHQGEAQVEQKQGNRPFKKRFIKRDKDGKPKVVKGKEGRVPKKGGKGEKKPVDRDLDR